jgi:DNA-binding transcriptional ArsR family regulator
VSILLEKKISVNNILTVNTVCAKAIEDEVRAKILQLLYKKRLNAVQITNRLKKLGYKKALTTIRHHIDILKDAGLIEVVKIEESRGGITKYYGTSTKLLAFTKPLDFEKKYLSTIKLTSSKLEKVLNLVLKKTSKSRKSNQVEYNDYLVMEIFNRAMTNLLEKN